MMKKFISFLCSILLVSAFCFGLVSCTQTNPTTGEKEDPRTFSFELVEDENGKTYTFTGFSLSEEAQALADAGNYAELAKLFNTDLKAGETTFNAETVRRFAVPQVFEGIKVTKVAMNAVSYQKFVNELVIPKTIEEIELGAFVGLSSLEKITIPFAGAKLGGVAEKRLFGYIFGEAEYTGSTAITQTFNNGSSENTKTYHIPASLKTVVITGDINNNAEETVSYYVNEDGKMVVLKDGATAPEGFETFTLTSQSYAESAVQPYAFHNVSMIENVEFKGTATIIPDYAFYGCGIKTLTIPTTVKTISKFAFANCASIRVIDLANVTEIREGGFNGCSSIGKNTETTVGSLNLSKVTTLGKDAFVGCSSLDAEKVTFNSSLTEEVKKDAFGEDFFEEE